MPRRRCFAVVLSAAISVAGLTHAADNEERVGRVDVTPQPIASDASVRYDYDIVYVRARRAGDQTHKRFYTDIAAPVTLEPGANLMLLHPDGTEELLVAGGDDGAVTDPYVSFDGQWVYYTFIHSLQGASQFSMPRKGADIYKIHLPSRRIVRLTNQKFTPNTGAADWSADYRTPEKAKTHLDYGVLNFGPCPLPGGRIVFTSNRDAFRPSKGYPQIAMQLFVMDDRDESIGEDEAPRNLEKIGHLNIAGALHPVVMTDGRIMFSSLESQGIRSDILWGIWTIHPDGTNWQPLVSAFDPGGAPNAFHFQAQLSDGSPVIEGYYNQNNSGFGSFIKLSAAQRYPAFGPANMASERNPRWQFGIQENGKPRWYRMPFMPLGSTVLTTFAHIHDGPADLSVPGDKNSPRVGKLTHPSGAPDNHLLCIYSPGPTNHQYTYFPQLDGGIYLIKNGEPVREPGQLLFIKNDPAYNESWPRAVVPYKRIYGIEEPHNISRLANDGTHSKHLPEGTPFALVGTSSFYKRESFPNGEVPERKVTAEWSGREKNDPWRGLDAFTSHGNGMPHNWHNQGGDAGLYTNDDIHAVRIIAMEPTTDRHRGERSGRLFYNHARERLRILGEIPLRKFDGDKQPLDPDGNPDTSFLAKIPADTAFTFQTLDSNGMVLNMAQTWHQLRSGEIRTDCGGCHAHSQEPTPFEKTVAAHDNYAVWDLVNTTPLVTGKSEDGVALTSESLSVGDSSRVAVIPARRDRRLSVASNSKSQQKWDAEDRTGLRITNRGVLNIEYHRDIRPILAKSCIACHTAHNGHKPAGNLNLDADDETVDVENKGRFPGTYARLAADERGRFGHKPVGYDSWGYPQASRYVRMFQSRRSLLIWKIYGKRLDGFTNDDHPSEFPPGSGELQHRGQPVDTDKNRARLDVDFVGLQMPPPDAIAGTYKDDRGSSIKIEPLTDDDRRTLVRWIDLGCPIDLDYNPAHPDRRGFGWMCDDNRPVITITSPRPGDRSIDRIVIGLHDYYSGLDMDSLRVEANVAVEGLAPGENLFKRLAFNETRQGVWQFALKQTLEVAAEIELTVSAKDRQGNRAHIQVTLEPAGHPDANP
jgi:hypothetical protein